MEILCNMTESCILGQIEESKQAGKARARTTQASKPVGSIQQQLNIMKSKLQSFQSRLQTQNSPEDVYLGATNVIFLQFLVLEFIYPVKLFFALEINISVIINHTEQFVCYTY